MTQNVIRDTFFTTNLGTSDIHKLLKETVPMNERRFFMRRS